MIRCLIDTIAIAYWLSSGLLLFYFIRSEEFGNPNKHNVFFDLGVCLILGGILTPLLVGATMIYYGVVLIKGDN